MMKTRRVLASAAAVLVGMVLLSWLARLSLFRIRQDTHNGHLVKVQGAETARQTFFSHYPGLTAVFIQVTDPFPPADQRVTLRLEALSGGGLERAVVTRPLGDLRAGDRLRFEFEPLDDSAGRVFRVEVQTQGAAPLTLVGHSDDLYTGGESAGGGDLMFEVRYNGRLWPTLQALLSRLAAGRPGLWGQPALYVVLAAAYGAAVLRVLGLLAHHAAGRAQTPPAAHR